VEAFDGPAPYSYVWETGAVGMMANGLCAGSFRVTATDAAGCTTVEQVTIGTNPSPDITLTATDASCAGNTGTATVTGTDFTDIVWSTGATTPTVSNLAPGLYSVTAVSDQNCSATASVPVNGADCHHTLTGRVFLDGTGNCQTGVGDVPLGGRLVTVQAGGPFLNVVLGGVFTQTDGSFLFRTEAPGPYGLKVWPGNQRVLPNLCDSIAAPNVLPGDTVSVGDLFLRADGFSDLAVTVSQGLAVNGQPFRANVCATNVGAQAASGTMNYQSAHSILSVSVPHTVVAPDEVQWNVPFLLPGESYCAEVEILAPLAPAGVQTDVATLDLIDSDPNNNTATWTYVSQPVMPDAYKQVCGSAQWTPIDNGNGTVSDCGPLNGFFLNYRIGFPNNTPNTVQTIEIRDTLDLARLALGSLTLQTATPNADVRLEGSNVLVVRMENAALAPAALGHVGYTIRPTGLFFSQFGQMVANAASVALLPAAAVPTNRSTCTYETCVGLEEANRGTFAVFPNPSDGTCWLQGEIPVAGSAVLHLSDALGRIIHAERLTLPGGEYRIPLALKNLPDGAYWLRLSTAQGTFAQKIIVVR
jgi:hypothetical protein